MSVGDDFLLEKDILPRPAEENGAGDIDHSNKNRWIYVRYTSYVTRLQIIDCHIIVEVKRALRPNKRKRTVGEALINASTMGFERPFGLIAGAKAINKLTFSFS